MVTLSNSRSPPGLHLAGKQTDETPSIEKTFAHRPLRLVATNFGYAFGLIKQTY